MVNEADWLFIPPSPAIRDATTTLFYPGLGLMEGINVNEGRGTQFPFKIFGAPWMNASQIHDAFQKLQVPGINAKFVTTSQSPGFMLISCASGCN